MMERVALSAGRCGSECVEYSTGAEDNPGLHKRQLGSIGCHQDFDE